MIPFSIFCQMVAGVSDPNPLQVLTRMNCFRHSDLLKIAGLRLDHLKDLIEWNVVREVKCGLDSMAPDPRAQAVDQSEAGGTQPRVDQSSVYYSFDVEFRLMLRRLYPLTHPKKPS